MANNKHLNILSLFSVYRKAQVAVSSDLDHDAIISEKVETDKNVVSGTFGAIYIRNLSIINSNCLKRIVSPGPCTFQLKY